MMDEVESVLNSTWEQILESAANDVRDKVSRAMRSLPEDADNPTVSKADASAEPILFITVESTKRTPLQLTDFANDVLIDQLQTIPGVSEAQVWGEKKRAMRLWMDPFKMASRNVTPQDVKTALDRENVSLPTGQLEGNQLSIYNTYKWCNQYTRRIQQPDHT